MPAVSRSRDEVGLFELVRPAEVLDEVATLALGPQPLVLAVAVLADHGRRGVEDDLRRAIVPLELDDLGLGKIVLEVENVAQVGATPAVDRLIGVSDDGEVPVALGQALNQVILRPVRVLILVDHHEPELFGVLLPHMRRLVEQLDRLQQQVVEVEGAVVFEALQVSFVHLRQLFPALAPPLGLEEVRSGHGVLRVADFRERHTRLHDAVVYLQLLEHLLHQRDLI